MGLQWVEQHLSGACKLSTASPQKMLFYSTLFHYNIDEKKMDSLWHSLSVWSSGVLPGLHGFSPGTLVSSHFPHVPVRHA